MTTSRERVLQALNFQTPDRLPKDLAGMRSTGISAFAYPKLVAALGLPPRLPKVEDTYQMLALPDLDVLDALGCDVITICDGVTNAFEQPEVWFDYDFNGRLPARVLHPSEFQTQADGSIIHGNTRMVSSSYVFDEPHGGQPLNLIDEIPRVDLKKLKSELQARELRDDQIRSIRDLCRKTRASTDKAVFLNDGSLMPYMAIHAYEGLASFPVLCITDPDYVTELHDLVTSHTVRNIQAVLPEISADIDILIVAGDDWGTQQNLIASPRVYRELFMPFRRRINDTCHQLAPQVKLFLHSCGAIYDLIDLIVESGFDILNPVQWSAGKYTYQEWKDKARNRIALWGGGVNAQVTLAYDTPAEIQAEARQVASYLAQDGGFVFCNIHNLLAEITPEKILALYRAV